MKLIIAGPRRIKSHDLVFEILDLHVGPMLDQISELVSGHSPGGGVDIIAEDWARSRGREAKLFRVEPWMTQRLGGRAPRYRNNQMAKFVGRRGGLFIVHDGARIVTPGTTHMLESAETFSLQYITSVSTDTPRKIRNHK